MQTLQKSTIHPQGLLLLSLCYALFMWTFGYLVSALNLFFINHLPHNTAQADSYTYTFLALLWILPIAGGYLSQRCGYFASATCGLILCIFGISCLSFSHQLPTVLFGLSCFLTGNALFTPSLWCLVDHLYQKEDQRRESGFTLFYLIFNLGCVAGIFCENQIKSTQGYSTAFLICLTTLLITLILLHRFKHQIDVAPNRCIKPQLKLPSAHIQGILYGLCGISSIVVTLLFLNTTIATYLIYLISLLAIIYLYRLAAQQRCSIQKQKVRGFLILCLFAVGFWVLYNLESSLLSVFIASTVNRHIHILGSNFMLPAESFFGFEGLAIVIIGLFFSQLWLHLAKKGKDPSLVIKFGLAILLIACGYMYLPLIIHLAGIGNKTPAILVILSYVFFASGELCIGPLGISMVGKLAPQGKEGILMGIWQLVIGVSAILGSEVATHARPSSVNIIEQHRTYINVFNKLGLVMIITGAVVLLLSKRVKRLLGDPSKDDTPTQFSPN
jgi:proton-dependent oligopeptide transporter, POT family